MIRNNQAKIAALLCGLLILLSCLFCSCGENLLLPTGGYDYRMSAAEGAILGYPIPRNTPNPYCYTLPARTDLPPAFRYDAEKMEYHPLETAPCTLALPDAEITVPCAKIHNSMTFFASRTETGDITVYEGDIGGRAVVLSASDHTLYLADATGAEPIAAYVREVIQVNAAACRLLFLDESGTLYEYRETDGVRGTVPISVGGSVDHAWYAYGTEPHVVVFRQSTPDAPSPTWYYSEDRASPLPCVQPQKAHDTDSAVFVRGTACILQGSDATSYFYDIRTGVQLDMDMGGLYRFSQNTEIAQLPLSPDGHFVYFYDIDFIYRLNLSTADLALAYNEAPIFEGSCILSSMTAVTDEIVLLSQASNEYTEFVPTITCAVFEEDIPEVRHEDDKIDLDYHPWQTE